MRKLGIILFTFVLVFVINSVTCFACTSFAVYSQKTYYGMNFDHYIDDIKFSIHNSNENNMKVFSMDFYSYGDYYPTVSMNNQGLFSSCQLVYPERSPVKKENENQMDMFELFYRVPFNNGKVKDIRDIINGKTMICQYNFVHTLFADITKDAMVLETNNNEKLMTEIKGKSIIMTNFFNSEMESNNIDNVTGIGSDRYVKAKEYIDDHINSFSYDEGMNALKNTIQENSPYPTQCSMLFDPTSAEVFIVMKRDFEKVWKVSINNGTIETFKGFNSHQSSKIGDEGILIKNLKDIPINFDENAAIEDVKTGNTYNQIWIIILVCSLFAIGLAILIVLKVRSKSV